MDTVNIILSGLGGQGILFMTRVLAQTAIRNGLDVIGAETHGMAQRGGSVISHLRIGEVEGSLVMIGSAHYLLSLDEIEGYRCLPFLARRGSMYVNSNSRNFPREEVKGFLNKNEIIHRSLPATTIAMELGAPMSTNLALLGFFAVSGVGPFSAEVIAETVEQISPDRFKETNISVFKAGFEYGAKKSDVVTTVQNKLK